MAIASIANQKERSQKESRRAIRRSHEQRKIAIANIAEAEERIGNSQYKPEIASAKQKIAINQMQEQMRCLTLKLKG